MMRWINRIMLVDRLCGINLRILVGNGHAGTRLCCMWEHQVVVFGPNGMVLLLVLRLWRGRDGFHCWLVWSISVVVPGGKTSQVGLARRRPNKAEKIG